MSSLPIPSAGARSLLACEDARVDVDGVPAVDGLALRAKGDRILVLGAPRALFLATAALAPVVRGRIAIRGTSASDAVREGVVAGAPLDPPLPPKWTATEYVTWSARLAGNAKSDAAASAKEAIDRVQLGSMQKTLLGRLPVHAKRAVVVAAALATGAGVIAIEDPLGNLAEEIARTWARLLAASLDGRSWIMFAPRISLTSPIALAADEAIVVSGSRVDAQGAPATIAAAERRYVARVHGPVAALAARLAERGVKIESDGATQARVVVDLGTALTTSELLAIASEVDVTVVELFPVARALA